jgi:hypothetical protein
MDISQLALQAPIDETKALGWDNPEQLEVLDEVPPNQEAFAIVGKLLTLKPIHPQLLCATMALVWNFASPLAIEMLAQNKFLFTVPLQSHIDHIMNQGPWNIRGSLLLLQPWSSNLTLEEIELHICPFLVQLHGFPMQNTMTQNAI